MDCIDQKLFFITHVQCSHRFRGLHQNHQMETKQKNVQRHHDQNAGIITPRSLIWDPTVKKPISKSVPVWDLSTPISRRHWIRFPPILPFIHARTHLNRYPAALGGVRDEISSSVVVLVAIPREHFRCTKRSRRCSRVTAALEVYLMEYQCVDKVVVHPQPTPVLDPLPKLRRNTERPPHKGIGPRGSSLR